MNQFTYPCRSDSVSNSIFSFLPDRTATVQVFLMTFSAVVFTRQKLFLEDGAECTLVTNYYSALGMGHNHVPMECEAQKKEVSRMENASPSPSGIIFGTVAKQRFVLLANLLSTTEHYILRTEWKEKQKRCSAPRSKIARPLGSQPRPRPA